MLWHIPLRFFSFGLILTDVLLIWIAIWGIEAPTAYKEAVKHSWHASHRINGCRLLRAGGVRRGPAYVEQHLYPHLGSARTLLPDWFKVALCWAHSIFLRACEWAWRDFISIKWTQVFKGRPRKDTETCCFRWSVSCIHTDSTSMLCKDQNRLLLF